MRPKAKSRRGRAAFAKIVTSVLVEIGLHNPLAACQRVGSHFLIRARSNLKVRPLKRFKDGSRLIAVPVRAKGRRQIVQWLTLREIRVRVSRPGQRTPELRLWTTLLEPAVAASP